jgi:hypothetical protein
MSERRRRTSPPSSLFSLSLFSRSYGRTCFFVGVADREREKEEEDEEDGDEEEEEATAEPSPLGERRAHGGEGTIFQCLLFDMRTRQQESGRGRRRRQRRRSSSGGCRVE